MLKIGEETWLTDAEWSECCKQQKIVDTLMWQSPREFLESMTHFYGCQVWRPKDHYRSQHDVYEYACKRHIKTDWCHAYIMPWGAVYVQYVWVDADYDLESRSKVFASYEEYVKYVTTPSLPRREDAHGN